MTNGFFFLSGGDAGFGGGSQCLFVLVASSDGDTILLVAGCRIFYMSTILVVNMNS